MPRDLVGAVGAAAVYAVATLLVFAYSTPLAAGLAIAAVLVAGYVANRWSATLGIVAVAIVAIPVGVGMWDENRSRSRSFSSPTRSTRFRSS